MNKALWDQGRIAMCHHKLVNCSSLSNIWLFHYLNIQQQIKFKGAEDSAQMFFWTSQTIFLHSVSLRLAEAQVLVDPNLLIMPDCMVVEYYLIEKQNISAC